MSQPVSSAFTTAEAAAIKQIMAGVLISFLKTTNATTNFFTINQSKINQGDKIKGAGGTIAFWDKYQYGNYSKYLLSLGVSRKIGQFPWGVVMAQADVEMDNNSKLFMPDYDGTIGAYVGKSRRPIKLNLGINAESISVFVGYTDEPKSNIGNDRRYSLHAFDAMNYIQEQKCAGSVFTDKYFHEIIAAGLIEMGFSSSQYVIENSLQQKIGFLDTTGKTWGQIFKDGCEAEQGLMFTDENGIIRFWNRQHMNSNATSQWTFNYSNMRNIEWLSTPIINDVRVIAAPREVKAKQKVWESGQTYFVPPGSSLDVFADTSDDDGPLPITSYDTPVYVTAAAANQSSYSTNSDQNGAGAALDTYITVSSTYNFGSKIRTTFTNSNTTTGIYITKLILWGTPAKVKNYVDQSYTDATSVADVGRNPSNAEDGQTLTITNNMIQDPSTANSLAYTIVKEYKDPRKRLKCTVFPVPHLQIGDAVTVVIADTAQSLLFYVVSITMKLGKNATLDMDLELEQRSIRHYFTINQSKIAPTTGQADTIAP